MNLKNLYQNSVANTGFNSKSKSKNQQGNNNILGQKQEQQCPGGGGSGIQSFDKGIFPNYYTNRQSINSKELNQAQSSGSASGRRNGKQSKKQQNSEMITNSSLSKKEFRVFYGIISTVDDCASPIQVKRDSKSNSNKTQYNTDVNHTDKTSQNKFTAEIKTLNQQDRRNLELFRSCWESKEVVAEENKELPQVLAPDDDVNQGAQFGSMIDFQETVPGQAQEKLELQDPMGLEQSAKRRKRQNSVYSTEMLNLKNVSMKPQQTSEGDSPPNHQLVQIKEWFKNLTQDERVNALTTTSPYLTEMLLNMKNTLLSKGPTQFAEQSPQAIKKNVALQNKFQNYHYLNQHYSQGYGAQYFMNTDSFAQSFEYDRLYREHSRAALADTYAYDYDNQYSSNLLSQYVKFEDSFWCKPLNELEIETFVQTEPVKYLATNVLIHNLRFCDLLFYTDTVSVSHDLVEDADTIFQALEVVTNGQAFTKPCHFQYNQQAGMHLIDQPSWFDGERYHSFACLLASIYEQNIWAYFYQWQTKHQKDKLNPKTSHVNLNYLFDIKDGQITMFEQAAQVKLHSLATSWCEISQHKKQELIENLRLILQGEEYQQQAQKYSATKSSKSAGKQENLHKQELVMPSWEIRSQFIRQNGFFMIDRGNIQLKQLDLIIEEDQLESLISESLGVSKNPDALETTKKVAKKKKGDKNKALYQINCENYAESYTEALKMITLLVQSDIHSVETGLDIGKRSFFQLIQQMYQNNCINELLQNEDNVGSGNQNSTHKSHNTSSSNQASATSGSAGPDPQSSELKKKRKKKKKTHDDKSISNNKVEEAEDVPDESSKNKSQETTTPSTAATMDNKRTQDDNNAGVDAREEDTSESNKKQGVPNPLILLNQIQAADAEQINTINQQNQAELHDSDKIQNSKIPIIYQQNKQNQLKQAQNINMNNLQNSTLSVQNIISFDQTNNHSQDPQNEKNNTSALIDLPSELAEINEINGVVNSGKNEDYENRENESEWQNDDVKLGQNASNTNQQQEDENVKQSQDGHAVQQEVVKNDSGIELNNSNGEDDQNEDNDEVVDAEASQQIMQKQNIKSKNQIKNQSENNSNQLEINNQIEKLIKKEMKEKSSAQKHESDLPPEQMKNEGAGAKDIPQESQAVQDDDVGSKHGKEWTKTEQPSKASRKKKKNASKETNKEDAKPMEQGVAEENEEEHKAESVPPPTGEDQSSQKADVKAQGEAGNTLKKRKNYKKQDNKYSQSIDFGQNFNPESLILTKNQTVAPQMGSKLIKEDMSKNTKKANNDDNKSIAQSRGDSPMGISDAQSQKDPGAGPRKRKRNKGKANVDHQEAMNQFIKQLQKDEHNYTTQRQTDKSKHQLNQNKANSRFQTRKNSDMVQMQPRPKLNPNNQDQSSNQTAVNEGNQAQQVFQKKNANQNQGQKKKAKEETQEQAYQTKQVYQKQNTNKNMYQEKVAPVEAPLPQEQQVAETQATATESTQPQQSVKQRKKLAKIQNQIEAQNQSLAGSFVQNVTTKFDKNQKQPSGQNKQISEQIQRQEIIDAFNISNKFTNKKKQQQTTKESRKGSNNESPGKAVAQTKESSQKVPAEDAQNDEKAEIGAKTPDSVNAEGVQSAQQEKQQVMQLGFEKQNNSTTLNQMNSNSPAFKPTKQFIPQQSQHNQQFNQNNLYSQQQNANKKLKFNTHQQYNFRPGGQHPYRADLNQMQFINENMPKMAENIQNFPQYMNQDMTVNQMPKPFSSQPTGTEDNNLQLLKANSTQQPETLSNFKKSLKIKKSQQFSTEASKGDSSFKLQNSMQKVSSDNVENTFNPEDKKQESGVLGVASQDSDQFGQIQQTTEQKEMMNAQKIFLSDQINSMLYGPPQANLMNYDNKNVNMHHNEFAEMLNNQRMGKMSSISQMYQHPQQNNLLYLPRQQQSWMQNQVPEQAAPGAPGVAQKQDELLNRQQQRNMNNSISAVQKIQILDSAKDIQNGIQNIIDNATSHTAELQQEEANNQCSMEMQTQNSTVQNDAGSNQEHSGNSSTDKQQNAARTRPEAMRPEANQANQFLITPSQIEQMTGQISHINQMNSYNINQFGNLNIGQISNNNYNQNGMQNMQHLPQIQTLPGLPGQFPNMPNLVAQNSNFGQHSNNNHHMGNMGNFQQAPQAQNVGQMQNMGQGGNGQNQFMNLMPNQMQQPGMVNNMAMQQQQYPQQAQFDYNMPQNIEYKFFEKFDNDIFDEVNNIQKQLDLCKDERNFVLQKLQTICEQVFKPQGSLDLSPNKSYSKSNDSNKDSQTLTPKIKQFGSLVTGLALESSDMDMAVTNLILPDREQMIENLDLFADNMKNWDLIQNLNAISTASIPVIKAIVDLNQLRDKEMNQYMKEINEENRTNKDFGSTQTDVSQEERDLQKQQQEQRNKQKIPEHLAKLKIDITFDDNIDQAEEEPDVMLEKVGSALSAGPMYGGQFGQGHFLNSMDSQFGFGISAPLHSNLSRQSSMFATSLEQKSHQGLASCKLIKSYVENYKCLKEVAIVLKQFLACMGLNSPYHGGLSSYSTVLLLVAYMNEYNLKMNAALTPSRLLMGFLDYYSYYFKVSMYGIDVSNGGSFYKHSSPESLFVILDPLNQQNNTTKNSFLTHEIIKSFRKAFNSLKNLLLQYQQIQVADISDNLLDVILEKNKAAGPSQAQQVDSSQQLPSQTQDQAQNIQDQQQMERGAQPSDTGCSDSLSGPTASQSEQQCQPKQSSKETNSNSSSQNSNSGQSTSQQQQQQPIQIQIQQIQQIQILQQLQQ